MNNLQHNSESQQLTVNLEIPIPSDLVIISKVELQELKQKELKGVYWTMQDLEKRINRKHEWIKENILYPSRFKKILDVDQDGFVFYPRSRGQSWSFHAQKMADFLDKNFQQIFSEGNNVA
jgi:phage pi2 protein 07